MLVVLPWIFLIAKVRDIVWFQTCSIKYAVRWENHLVCGFYLWPPEGSVHPFNTRSLARLVASVVSDSVRPHRRKSTRLPRPWDSPGKNTGVGCHFLLQCRKVESESEVAHFSDFMDCSLPGSSVHGIFQARVLEGVPLPSLPFNTAEP